MKARELMTRHVLSVTPNTPVRQIASYLLDHAISAVPVIDAKGTLLGIVSEGDLQRRPETGTVGRKPWWLQLLAAPEDEARAFKKTHGLVAADVMTKGVVAVTEDTDLAEIADLLENRRIKRVPVVSGGKVVGIVSRSNLLRAFARTPLPAASRRSDRDIREDIDSRMKAQSWTPKAMVNVAVDHGVVEISGLVESSDQRDAARILVEGVPGVVSVKDSLAVYRFSMVT
jgi:CBS domain-containing protein